MGDRGSVGFSNWLQDPYPQPDNSNWGGYDEDRLLFWGYGGQTPTWNDARGPLAGSYAQLAPGYVVEAVLSPPLPCSVSGL